MYDLTVGDGLGKMLVEAICKDEQIVKECGQDIDVTYVATAICEEVGDRARGLFDEKLNHLGFYLVENEHNSIECYLLAKKLWCSDLVTQLLATFSVSTSFWERWDGEPDGDELADVMLKIVKGKINEVFPEVLEEYKKLVRETRDTSYVRYAILETSGPLGFVKGGIDTIPAELALSYFDEKTEENWCVAESGAEIERIINHVSIRKMILPFDRTGCFAIVWQRVGEVELHASYVELAQTYDATLKNGGADLKLYSAKKLETYDYIFDTVANSRYFLDYETKTVKHVSDVDESKQYFCVDLSYDFDCWHIYMDGGHTVCNYSLERFPGFAEAYAGMRRTVEELREREENTHFGMTSPFGALNLVKFRMVK